MLDNVSEIKFDDLAFDRLVLPEENKVTLSLRVSL
jgi:hypothetical protein